MKGLGQNLFMAVLIAIYVPMAFYGMSSYSANTDEFIYMLMGREMATGHLPYIDFFTAHQPLMLAPIALAQAVLGTGIAQAKSVPLILSFLLIILTYLVCEKIRPTTGPLACFLLLLSPEFQKYSHACYGIMLPSALLMLSFYAHLMGKKKLSAIACALAPLARLNALPATIAMIWFNRHDRDFLKGLMMMSPSALLLLVPGYVDQTIMYHLSKPSMPLDFRLHEIFDFAQGQWLPLLLFAVSLAHGIPSKRDRPLLAMVCAFYAFHLVSFSIFSFYLFIGLAPAVSYAATRLRFGGKRNLIIVSFIILWVALSAQTITQSYALKVDEPTAQALLGLVDPGQAMVCYSRRCPYMHLMSDMAIEGDLIDLSDPRILQDPNEAGLRLEKALVNDPEIVLVDLKELNIQHRKMGADFTGSMNMIFSDYFPLLYDNRISLSPYIGGNFWSDINHIVIFGRADEVAAGDMISPMAKNGTRRFRETYVLYEEDKFKNLEFTSEVEGDMSALNVPPYLQGKNPLNMTVMSPDAIQWPLKYGTHTVIEKDITYHVWVSPAQGLFANIFIIALDGGHIISFTQATFDPKEGMFIEVRVFSKLSERMLTGYAPTYTQKLIM